jgi:hypothetical protein
MSIYIDYGDGSSTLRGRDVAGDQVLVGPTPGEGSSFDEVRITGDVNVLTDRTVGGDDRISSPFANTNVLTGDAQFLGGRSQGGDDTITASSGFNNTLYGDGVQLLARAEGGDDVLDAPGPGAARASASSDLYGDAFLLADRAQGGDDTLGGAVGFEGSTARLYGDGFELRDEAQGGNDRLVSRSFRNDEMWGDAYLVAEGAGTGRDVFAFGAFNGRDQINDFRRGEDVIDLTVFQDVGIVSFETLAERIIEQADGTLITLDIGTGSGNSVFVAGVTGLDAGDFLFR